MAAMVSTTINLPVYSVKQVITSLILPHFPMFAQWFQNPGRSDQLDKPGQLHQYLPQPQ